MNKAYLYIFLAAVIFSTMELAGKIVMADINPFQLNFIRFLIGALVLFPMALQSVRERNITFQMDDYLYFLAAGFLNVVVSMSLFQFSLLYIMASTVAVVFCVNPIFTTLFAHFLIREKFTGTAIVALAVSICGVLTVLDPFGLHADLRGIILIVLSAISFALYSVIAKMRVAGYGSVVLTCFSFLGGDAILLIVMLLSHLPVFNHLAAGVIPRFLVSIPIIAGITFHNIGVLLYLGVVVTGLGFLLYFMALEKSRASTGSIAFFLKTALAPLFCYLLLGERLSTQSVIGIVLILAGAYITLSDKQRIVRAGETMQVCGEHK